MPIKLNIITHSTTVSPVGESYLIQETVDAITLTLLPPIEDHFQVHIVSGNSYPHVILFEGGGMSPQGWVKGVRLDGVIGNTATLESSGGRWCVTDHRTCTPILASLDEIHAMMGLKE